MNLTRAKSIAVMGINFLMAYHRIFRCSRYIFEKILKYLHCNNNFIPKDIKDKIQSEYAQIIKSHKEGLPSMLSCTQRILCFFIPDLPLKNWSKNSKIFLCCNKNKKLSIEYHGMDEYCISFKFFLFECVINFMYDSR